MLIKDDGLHYKYRPIDGYNKTFNIVLSCREPGKSSGFFFQKVWPAWAKNGLPLLYLVRNVVEITEQLITTIQDTIINKFCDEEAKLEYCKGDFKSGFTDIKINGKLFIRIVALSIPLRRIKQTLLKDCYAILFDEFIINPKLGEKYLKGEATIIKELYNTYKRERADKTRPLKMYFLGNPYSLFNPIFVWLGISPSKLKLGEIYAGEDFVVDWYKMNPLLREKILKENPAYKFDEDYMKYALEGEAINDKNIKIVESLPADYSLKFVFKYNDKLIGIFKNHYYIDFEDKYYCCYIKEYSQRTIAYCFDFSELIDRCALISRDDKNKFAHFKMAMRSRAVAFSSIDCYYLIEEIYNFL